MHDESFTISRTLENLKMDVVKDEIFEQSLSNRHKICLCWSKIVILTNQILNRQKSISFIYVIYYSVVGRTLAGFWIFLEIFKKQK